MNYIIQFPIPKEEKDWLWNRMQEAKKEVEAWPKWMKEMHGVRGDD